MKALRTIGVAAFLAFLLAGTALAAQAPVPLGTAGNFAVLAGETITNTGPTTITGDVGLHPGTDVTGFNSVTLHGALHKTDAVALQAKNDLVAAYNNAAGRTPVTIVPTELGGQNLKAGVYGTESGTLGLTGTLTLDAEGNSNAVFIFQAASTLITAPSSGVVLVNGASLCNVYWQVGSSATLDTSTSFMGHILALTSISMKTGATLQGSALARNGSVTLDTNVITNAACASSSPSPSPRSTPRPRIVPPATSTQVADSSTQPLGGGLPVLVISLAAIAVTGYALLRSKRARR